MYDVNPLGLTMYLRELDRQATPKLRRLRPGRKSISIVFLIGWLRRRGPAVASGQLAQRP